MRARLLPWCLGAALAVGVLAPAAVADAPPPYATKLKALERVCLRLADGGRKDEAAELVDVLDGLGYPDRALGRLRKKCADSAGDKPLEPAQATTSAKQLRRAAGAIARYLAELDEPRRKEVAALLLRLDQNQGASHEALGHERMDGEWVPPEIAAQHKRMKAIDAAVAQALELTVNVETGDGALPFVVQLTGEKGRRARWERVSITSTTQSDERMTEMIRGLVRALALSNYLQTGELKLPKLTANYQLVICGSHELYLKAIGLSAEAGELSRGNANIAKRTTRYRDKRGFRVEDASSYDRMMSGLLVDIWHSWMFFRYRRMPQPALAAGHTNWLSLRCFGRAIPGFVWREAPAERTAAVPMDADKRAALLEEAQREWNGARSYLEYLALHESDPAFARCIQANIGNINGDELLKSTVVCGYLHETGRFLEVLDATAKKPATAPTFEAALGMGLADFEVAWRAWLLSSGGGLADRLERRAQ